MKTLHALIMSLLIILILSSCVTRKKLTYLQYSDKLDNSLMPFNDNRINVTPDAYKIRLYDNLYIRVITPDPQWSEMFNTVSATAGGTLTEQSAALLGYPVDGNGDIELPFAGKLKVAGKTLSEIKTELDSTLKNYVTDASITVRMVNNFVSVIGEVRAPGRYPLIKDHLNIFEALSMAGDMSEYSNRRKVQLIRQSPYGTIVKEFSLTDRSILTSEFYYLIPNDIIYAQPMKGKIFQMNSSIYSMILSSITTFFVIFSFFRAG
jgi:polysaccharide export outer membrane protein